MSKMIKNIDDVLKMSISNTIKSSSQIVKQKKKSKKIQQTSKVFLTPDKQSLNIKNMSLGQIGIKKQKQWKIKDINKWTGRDFAIYMADKYYNRYNQSFDYKLSAIPFVLPKIKDTISQSYGSCNNIILRCYIDYFFMARLDIYIIKMKYKHWMKLMYKQQNIVGFLDNYKFNPQHVFDNQQTGKQIAGTPKQEEKIFGGIDDAYALGAYNLIMQYGVFASINYLIMRCGKKKQVAYNIILNAVLVAVDRKKINQVTEMTIKYCACPISSPITNLQQFNYLLQQNKIKLQIKEKLYLSDDCKF